MPEYRRILLDGATVQVTVDGDELVAGDGRRVKIEEARHLPPVVPSKVVAVHLNHRSRVDEFQIRLTSAPTYFHKPTSSLNSHQGAVVRPEGCKWLNYEGEVAIVIGRTARNISQAEAGEYIAGYTVANDYGLHDFRDTDAGSMLRVKGSDTLCPLGPGLVTDWDFHGKYLRTYVNGEVVQDGSTDEMEWDMHYLVADIARTITLHPGDVLLSGTPANSRPVSPGDVVEVEVEGLGRLDQPHRHRTDPDPDRRRRAAHRVRGGAVHRARRRLGVPRHPGATALTVATGTGATTGRVTTAGRVTDMTEPAAPRRPRKRVTYGAGREALLNAAVRVVARGGLRKLTYRAVAEEAGVTHGLVVHHFGSRDALIEEALTHAIRSSLTSSDLETGTGRTADFSAGLTEMVESGPDLQAFQYELLLESRRRPELLTAPACPVRRRVLRGHPA